MTFELEIGGRVRRVTIEAGEGAGPDGGPFTVKLDAGTVEVVAVRTDLGVSLLLPGGRSIDVALSEKEGGAWLAQLPHVTVPATIDGRREPRGRPGEVATAGAQRVVAPMPGRVVKVLVAAGDQVEARQGLFVMEAMKMENELSSPKGGVVREVAVAEGASVDAGRLLVVVE
jgi:biotin carboxyl carrier protein